MAGSYDFFLSGDHDAARAAVSAALEEQEFRVSTTPAGLKIERGKLGATLFLGAMAGKNFHISYTVQYFVDERGTLVARLNREMATGALKGGALGAAKVSNLFDEVGARLEQQLGARGILLGSKAV